MDITTVEDSTTDITEADAGDLAEWHREKLIANLKALTAALETHPDLPIPYGVYVSCYVSTEQARAGRKGIPGWTKTSTPESAYTHYEKCFGGGSSCDRSAVVFEMSVPKSETCQRVQAGTRHVDEVPAHDEPVWRWDCGTGTEDD